MADPVGEHDLRAAALSTLKLKRRKQLPEKLFAPVLKRQAPPPDSFQLDYGADEDPSKRAETPSTLQRTTGHRSTPPTVEDEGHSREEGEISEEEDPPPPKENSSPIHHAFDSTWETRAGGPDHLGDGGEHPATEGLHTASVSMVTEKTQLPVLTPTLMDRISNHGSKAEEQAETLTFPIYSAYIDSEHVRPGITLNQEEYDSAKDIVLDLLGRGVDFAFLLKSGLSKSLLYYIFSELNLRLPDNFDRSGIIPYTPESVHHFSQHPTVLTNSSLVSDESVVEKKPMPIRSLSSRLTTPPPSVNPSAISPLDSDLHDMERRRRQELLARKAAVQASRKHKSADPTKTPVNSSADNGAPPLAPAHTVDDFLKSIGSVEDFQMSGKETLDRRETHDSRMDIDIEGEQIKATESAKELEENSFSDGSFSEPPPPSSEPPPTSVSSTTTSFSPLLPSTFGSTVKNLAPKQPPVRGTKRPVASDFVDFESPPRKSRHAERRNGNTHPVVAPRRPATASFHNVGSSRRCVIDLSDSDDDDDQQPSQRRSEDSIVQRKEVKRPNKKNTNPVPTPFKPSDAMSPAALVQKESEIRRMRELIAQREEETRLKKLAAAKSQSISISRPSSTIPFSGMTLKQEDLDVVMAVAERLANNGQLTKNKRDPESATPPETPVASSPPNLADVSMSEVPSTVLEGTTASEAPKPLQSPDESAARGGAQVPSNNDRKQESLAQPSSTSAVGSVDADTVSLPSAQVELMSSDHQKQDAKEQDQSVSVNKPMDQEQTISNFFAYRSPFVSYPRLRSRLEGDSAMVSIYHKTAQNAHLTMPGSKTLSTKTPLHSLSSSLTGYPLPDFRALKLTSAIKNLDPSNRLCQYEIPGSGKCRDAGCRDVHLSKLKNGPDPTPEDTAQFLFSSLPQPWLSQRQITSPTSILDAINWVKNTVKHPLSFEDRVAHALLSIGPPPTS